MARSANQKLKLLYLKDYLLRSSDEEHPLTISDMIGHLGSCGIQAERKSLYSDIEALQNYGLDIIKVKGRAAGYYAASRDFELPEIKLLVDAIQSSRFITTDKTLKLISKIEGLASVHQGRRLQRQVVVQNRVKTMNESVFYNVDALSEAIEGQKCISFKYFEYDRDKNQVFRNNGQRYHVSPEFLVWDDENYYLVSIRTDDGQLRHFRVDKMSDIAISDLPALPASVDQARYTSWLFGMYGGEVRSVRLKFANELAGVAIDRFGKNVTFAPFGDDHFTVNVEVIVSPQFMAWLVGLGGKVQILSPDDVRERFKKHLRGCLEIYE